MIVILRVVTCTHNLETGAAVGDKRTWNCVKKPVTYSTLLLMTIFLSALGSSHHPPTPSSNVVAKKKHSFPPIVLKINFVWGGRGEVTSFTNITGNVPTLLTPHCAHQGVAAIALRLHQSHSHLNP